MDKNIPLANWMEMIAIHRAILFAMSQKIQTNKSVNENDKLFTDLL